MNARAMEPAMQEFILGDLLLHTRFSMAVNQFVLQHLQSFDLSRLKITSHGSGWHAGVSAARGYAAEPM